MKMQNILKKTAALLAAVCAIPAAGCVSGGSMQQSSTTEPDPRAVTGEVKITAFNVGKADALVVQSQNSVTVIDAGNKGDGKYIDKYLSAQGIDTVDRMIITHFDKDHVGGASRVVNKLKVKEVIVPDYTSEIDEYRNFIEKTEETETPVTVLAAGSDYYFEADDIAATIYAPMKTDYGKDEENDFSLALYMQHGEKTFLFAGDAEDARQQELMDLKLGTVDFLKFPYHGNYMKTTEAFLDAFKPKCTIVCCSEKEYADPSTVDTLQKRGIETYYTCDGTVTVVSDGKQLTCSQEAAAEK